MRERAVEIDVLCAQGSSRDQEKDKQKEKQDEQGGGEKDEGGED